MSKSTKEPNWSKIPITLELCKEKIIESIKNECGEDFKFTKKVIKKIDELSKDMMESFHERLEYNDEEEGIQDLIDELRPYDD